MSNGRPKNPTVAGVLSGLLPGLGQFYCRRWGKGAGFLIGMLGLDGVTGVTGDTIKFFSSGVLPASMTQYVAGSLLLLALAIWSIADAVRTARKSAQ